MITRAAQVDFFLKSGESGAREESGARGDEPIPLPLGKWNARVHFSHTPDWQCKKSRFFFIILQVLANLFVEVLVSAFKKHLDTQLLVKWL